MNVLITLTSAGTDTGPFNLYSNVDNYTTAFETNISKGILVAGYTSTIVPPGTSAIRVKSMGICTNYVDITLTVPATTTSTTTTAAPISTSTTTSTSTSTSTTTAYVGPVTTTTTSTTAAPVITTTTTSTTAAPVITTTTTSTSTSTTSTSTSTTSTTTAYVGPSTTTTTSSTTTSAVLEWYQITNCATLAVDYSAGYAPGTFAINNRVDDFGLNIYTITNTYSTNPGGSGLFIGSTGFTGCPGVTSTTTSTTSTIYFVGSTTTSTSTSSTTTSTSTTAAPPAPANILVDVANIAGPDQDCLGTPYNVMTQVATATLYDQYGNQIQALVNIDVVLNVDYNPCYGGSIPTTRTVTILAGYSSGFTNWDSSRTVDCGGEGCLVESEFFNCAFSNTAGLAWRSGTTSC